MRIEKKQVNFEDARGTITDIFVKDPKDHVTIIMTTAGSIRGNHYHKHSRQHDFLISGKMKVAGKNMETGETFESEWNPYELVTWEANVAHAFQAIEDSVMMTFVDGKRGGEDYESDTYRLEGDEKLIS